MPWPGDEGEKRWQQAWTSIKKVRHVWFSAVGFALLLQVIVQFFLFYFLLELKQVEVSFDFPFYVILSILDETEVYILSHEVRVGSPLTGLGFKVE